MKIGSVSLWLGDTNKDDSYCLCVGNSEVFIHGTIAELVQFREEIGDAIKKKQTELKELREVR